MFSLFLHVKRFLFIPHLTDTACSIFIYNPSHFSHMLELMYSIFTQSLSFLFLFLSVSVVKLLHEIALSFLPACLSSFQSSGPRRGADPFGVLLESTGPGMVLARRSSWRKCSRAMRRASEVTLRRLFICTAKPCKLTHRTASCTVTVQQLFSNWDSTKLLWMMRKRLVSSIPNGQRSVLFNSLTNGIVYPSAFHTLCTNTNY